LLLGAFGSGKSSFLNTLLKASESSEEARVSGDRDHGTVTLDCYQIPSSKICIWDCWGFSKKNFDVVMLNEILDGHFETGKEMHSGISRNTVGFRKSPKPQDMIHNVIFVVAAPDLEGNPELNCKIKEFSDLLVRKDYRPTMVLTKIDLIDKSLSKDPQMVFLSKKIAKCVYSASKMSGLSPNMIIPVKNYHFEFDRNALLENGHLLALTLVCKYAQSIGQKIERHSEQQTIHSEQQAISHDREVEEKSSMDEYLNKHGLQTYVDIFESIGVHQPEDVEFTTETDLVEAGFKKITIRKILKLQKSFTVTEQ